MKLSEAIAAGLEIAWPGPRHHGYPVTWIDGKRTRLVDDTCKQHAWLRIGERCEHCQKLIGA